ncbi:MAG TPA: radical SAM protein [bacterium]|nr:radical SAM protein [bacterium]
MQVGEQIKKQDIMNENIKKLLFFLSLIKCRLFKIHKPLYVYWFITNKCNLKCEYCYGRFYENSENELSTDELLTLADLLVENGMRRVTLLGGEPFIRSDINLLVDKLYSKNVSILILSNGYNAINKPDILKKIDEIGFSIDGSEDIQNKIRGDGYFQRLKETIKFCKQFNKPIVLTYTLFEKNIDDIDFVMNFARENKLLLTINIAHGYIEKYKDFQIKKCSNSKYKSALEKISDYKKKKYPLLRANYTLECMKKWPDYCKDTAMTKPDNIFPECYFGKYAACVSASGALYPCFLGSDSEHGKKILESGFQEAWENCRKIPKCSYCHVPCFLEYNALFELNPSIIINLIKKLILKKI